MATIFPTSKIEEMKEQGIDEHLIDLVSMDFSSFMDLVSRNIESGAIYKQFLNAFPSEQPFIFRYAFAAGLISKADADFLNKLQKEFWEGSEDSEDPEPVHKQTKKTG